MKAKLTHHENDSTLTFVASSDRERELLHHLVFGLCSPDGIKKAISDSDTDLANSLTKEDLDKFRAPLNSVWRENALKDKIDVLLGMDSGSELERLLDKEQTKVKEAP